MRRNLIGTALLAAGLAGCATIVVSNYRPGTAVSATVGYPLVDVRLRDPVLSWRNLVRQVVYGGRSGDTIKLTYREFRTQGSGDIHVDNLELQFDLSQTTRIAIQEMRFEVLQATSEKIFATVLPSAREDSRGQVLEPEAELEPSGPGVGESPRGVVPQPEPVDPNAPVPPQRCAAAVKCRDGGTCHDGVCRP